MYLDLHTHHPQLSPSSDLVQVLSLRPGELPSEEAISAAIYTSCGLHPWYTEDFTSTNLLTLEARLQAPKTIALGEMGLDKVCSTPLALQEEYFCLQIELAEAFALPVILHLVKAWDELLRLKKLLRPKSPWIIHGFRGKAQQAKQLLDQGFYLSFGVHAHPEAQALAFRAQRLFLETDYLPSPHIDQLYKSTAERLSCPEEQLIEQIHYRQKEVFPIL